MTDKLQFSVRLTPGAHAILKQKSKHVVGVWLSELIEDGWELGILEQMQADIEELKKRMEKLEAVI